MTRDIDLVLELDPKSVPAFAKRLESDYYVPVSRAHQAAVDRTMFNVIHQESVIKVDCVLRKDTEYRRMEFDRRVRVTIQDFDTFLVSKEDLILSKMAWAKDSRSELQLKDVKNLLGTGFDEGYVETWAARLGVSALLKELRDA